MDNWSDRLKAIAHDVAGLIPEVGKLAQVALDIFWPGKDKPNIWQEIQQETQTLIDKNILQHELSVLNSLLDSIKQDFVHYTSYSNPPVPNEQQIYIGDIITTSDKVFNRIKGNTDRKQRVHLLPLLVALAPLELTALREQYSHGEEIFGKPSPAYKTQLENKYNDYQQIFETLYGDWKKWRAEQIMIDNSFEAQYGGPGFHLRYMYYATITDNLTKENKKLEILGGYADSSDPNTSWGYDQLKKPAEAVKEMFMGDSIADMANTLSSAFYLHNFLPDTQTYDEPVYIADLGTVTLGPYSSWFWGDDAKYFAITESDGPGTVDTIGVHADDNAINGIQLFFSDRLGRLAGEKNGTYTPIAGMQLLEPLNSPNQKRKHVVGFNTRFHIGSLSSIQALYSDKSKSQHLGTDKGILLSGKVPNSYKIAGANYGFSGERIATISFMFNYMPKFTTIEATSSSATSSMASATAPFKVNGQPVSEPYKIKPNQSAIEMLIIRPQRPRGCAILYHRVYSSGLQFNQAWSHMYQDVTAQGIDKMEGFFLFLSAFQMGGLLYPPQQICEFLLNSGAGTAFSEWVNNPTWQNASDPHYQCLSYVLGGTIGAGESHGFEKLAHGPTAKSNIKLYICDQNLQDKVCPPSNAK